MAAKVQSTSKKLSATFEVSFKAPGLHPATISLRTVGDALSAVQNLASGRDPFETTHVPPEESIGLVDVRTGSAIYSCYAHAPKEATANLGRIGRLLAGRIAPGRDRDDLLLRALRPIELLSKTARKLECEVHVRLVGQRTPAFVVQKDVYESISRDLLIRGESTVTGTVQRVGGATRMKCLMRVPGRGPLLYCNVKGAELARSLGQHLYETIVATGTATWIHRSWRIYRFTITNFSQPNISSTESLIKELREAGLDAWDNIDDPEAYLRELRS